MWELDYKESWVPKNWCFWTVVLEKTLESPLDCKEIKPSILKEINPEYSSEGLVLKHKLQYFDYLIQRADSLEKTLMLGKLEGRRRSGQQRMRWLDGILTQRTWVWASSRRQWRTGKPGVMQSMESQRVRQNWVTEQQQFGYKEAIPIIVSTSLKLSPKGGNVSFCCGILDPYWAMFAWG